MTEPALCQCIKCSRYLTKNREIGGPQQCAECAAADPQGAWEVRMGGIPLAEIRGTLVDPLSREVLDLLSEESAEVIQRCSKIGRWGWKADFQGTTQQYKLECELGDQLAVLALAVYNGQVTAQGVLDAYVDKIRKLIEDAEGPRQRLLHAEVPNAAHLLVLLVNALCAREDGAGAYIRVNIIAE